MLIVGKLRQTRHTVVIRRNNKDRGGRPGVFVVYMGRASGNKGLDKMGRNGWIALGIGVVIALLFAYYGGGGANRASTRGEVVVPARFSETALAGKAIFESKCITCHGKNAAGTSNGPALVHKIYEPNHHSDGAFLRAARLGVRAHHWRFGDMPPVAGVSPEDVRKVVAYIRELQRANGIF